MDEAKKQEILALKEEATELGLQFHPATGIKKLKKLIKEFKEFGAAQNSANEAPVEVKPAPAKRQETKQEMYVRIRREATKLVRVRVSCMNPNKKDWPGEIVSVSNRAIGTVKKFIPFNAEDGWHLPQVLVNLLKEKQCQVFVKARVNGREIKKGKLIKEFSVEILPQLTEKELKELAASQAAKQSIG